MYVIQGLCTSPWLSQKLRTVHEEPIQGNDMIAQIFGFGTKVRHKEFRKYF